MKKSTIFLIVGIVLALCCIIAPVSASTITTLAQLQSAATAGGSHVLGANISNVSITIPNGVTLTLDLKNYNLTRNSNMVIVLIKDATFNLYGSSGKITQSDPTIRYSISPILTDSPNSRFNMYGGNICDNNVTFSTVNVAYGGTFTMYGGSISGNRVLGGSSATAGGVNITSNGTFIMNGGEISGNHSDNNCGGVNVTNTSTFTMNGGTITGNSCVRFGAGVYVSYSGTFTLTNGTISNNHITTSGFNGGGVFINTTSSEGATFIMSGGKIEGNSGASYGGGISIGDNSGAIANCTITGGEIINNSALTNGGGVFCDKNGRLNISGNVTINNNKVSSSNNNVYLSSGDRLVLTGSLTGGTVYIVNPLGSGVKFGATNSTSYSGINHILSDDGLYEGGMSGTNLVWVTYIPPLSLDNFTTNPTSGSYLPTNKSVTLTATISGGTSPFSYVWSYTTTPNPTTSSSWTNIGTTSANSTTYTPTSTGTYTFRVIVYAGSTSEDSLSKSFKPYLNIFVALNGGGISSSPYQVGSNSDLQNWNTYATYYNDKYMVITQDFVPATTVSTFAGNLAGGNHTLTNARLPLFNTLGGTVNNLKFTNSIVSGNGILANTSSAAVSNVTADDCFVGGSTTGGLVGNATGSFTDCTVNHITVKGSSTAGGIAGAGNTTVTRCKVLNSDLLAPTTYGVCA